MTLVLPLHHRSRWDCVVQVPRTLATNGSEKPRALADILADSSVPIRIKRREFCREQLKKANCPIPPDDVLESMLGPGMYDDVMDPKPQPARPATVALHASQLLPENPQPALDATNMLQPTTTTLQQRIPISRPPSLLPHPQEPALFPPELPAMMPPAIKVPVTGVLQRPIKLCDFNHELQGLAPTVPPPLEVPAPVGLSRHVAGHLVSAGGDESAGHFRNLVVTAKHVACSSCGKTYSSQAFDNHRSQAKKSAAGFESPCAQQGTKLRLPIEDVRLMAAIEAESFLEARQRIHQWVKTGSTVLPGEKEEDESSDADFTAADQSLPLAVQARRMKEQIAASEKKRTRASRRRQYRDGGGCKPTDGIRGNADYDSDSGDDDKAQHVMDGIAAPAGVHVTHASREQAGVTSSSKQVPQVCKRGMTRQWRLDKKNSTDRDANSDSEFCDTEGEADLMSCLARP